MFCLRPEYNVTWDENKLEGPSKLVGPYLYIFRFLKKERRIILWEDVVAHGHAGGNYFFILSQNGVRIYFNWNWKNSHAFEEKCSEHVSLNGSEND